MRQLKIFQKNFFRSRRGFTLVELLVAMGVFLVAVTLAIGAFVQALKAQRFVTYMMSVNSNASIALESMAREIRAGYNFSVDDLNSGSTCSVKDNQYDILNFTNADGQAVGYELANGSFARCAGNDCAAGQYTPLTASNILVDRLCFWLNNTKNDKSSPWRVTVFLTVDAKNQDFASTPLNLQTTVSARVLPNEAP